MIISDEDYQALESEKDALAVRCAELERSKSDALRKADADYLKLMADRDRTRKHLERSRKSADDWGERAVTAERATAELRAEATALLESVRNTRAALDPTRGIMTDGMCCALDDVLRQGSALRALATPATEGAE